MPIVNTPLGRFQFSYEPIRDFCGGMFFHNFNSGFLLHDVLYKLQNGGFKALTDEEMQRFAATAELVYIEMVKCSKDAKLNQYHSGIFNDATMRRYFQTRMQWWDARHRPMYWVGKYFKAGAGKGFINPNSGNFVRFFLMPANWNRYKRLCKKHNVPLTR